MICYAPLVNIGYWSIELHYVYRLVNDIYLVKLHHIDQNHGFHLQDLLMGSSDSYGWCDGEPIQQNRLAVATLAVATLFGSLAPIASTLSVADT